MKAKWNNSTAVIVLATLGAGATQVWAQQAPAAKPAATTAADNSIPDIIVTATRRDESANKVPIAIQALSGASLQKLNVTNFEKLIEYLPNVRTASHGPGTSSIYIRGLSTDSPGLQIQGTAGTSPSVALYINDAPASLVGRNLDLYPVDLQRVEVLAGPQGTLFGASAMGGAVRYITNKPDLSAFHAGFNASTSFTKGATKNSISGAGDAFLNIPIAKDRLAVRFVFYKDKQGGYIDNVPGTFQVPFDGHVGQPGRLPTGNPLLVERALQSCQLTATTVIANCDGSQYKVPIRQSINNNAFVKQNYNEANYTGGRVALKFQIDDDWSFDIMHLRQKLKSDGAFDYNPDVGDLKVTQFAPNTLSDKFSQTTWTLTGRLSILDLVYTGSYLDHNAVQKADYATYSNIGLFVPYYECDRGVYYTAAYNGNIGNTCYSPNKSYQVRNKTQRYTQEFRVTTPAKERLRGTLGVFYDINKLYDNTDWSYLVEGAGFINPRAPDPAVNPFDPSIRPVKVGFFNDVQRRDRQFAVYGEASFDVIPDALTVTGGLRYYNEKASQNGSSSTSFGTGARGVYDPVTGTYSVSATPPKYYGISANLNTLLAKVSPATYSGVLLKGNLTYKFGNGSLAYVTYSDGFRPGGFNRKPCNVPSTTCPTSAEFAALAVYTPDKVKNYEIGTKLSLLDKSLQINLAAYRIDWSNIQQTVFDQNISNQTFTTNLSNARIYGVEGDATWRATSELTINTAFSYNDSKLTSYVKDTKVLLPIGSPLALSPKFQGNLRLRYDKELSSGLKAFVQTAFHHVGSSISSDISNVDIRYQKSNPTLSYIASIPITYNGVVVKPGDVVAPIKSSLPQAGYNTFSLSFGINKADWSAEVFGDNLTDERPELYRSGNDGVNRTTTSRPRTIGLRFSYKM